MGLLNYANLGRGMLGQRRPPMMPTVTPQTQPGGVLGGLPRPVLPGRTGAQIAGTMPPITNSSPVQPNDDQMSGYGPGGGSPLGARSEGNVQDWITQRNSVEPHDYFSLGPFKPEEMAIGAALGQAPLGGMLASIFGPIGSEIWNQKEGPYFGGANKKPSDVARDFAMSMPVVGPAVGFGHWLSGTPYAQNNPVATFSREGENEATMIADRMFRSGGNVEQMQRAFDAVRAQQNAGGAGNPAQVARDQWNAMMRDGRIHIGEPGWENPNAVSPENANTVGSTIFSPDGSLTSPVGEGFDFFGQPPGLSTTGITGGPGVSFGVQPGGPDLLGVNPGQAIDAGSQSDAGGGDMGGWNDPGSYDGGTDYPDRELYKGGILRKPAKGSPNPPGPDDQVISAQSGEGVLNRGAMGLLGRGKFEQLNRAGLLGKKRAFNEGGVVGEPAGLLQILAPILAELAPKPGPAGFGPPPGYDDTMMRSQDELDRSGASMARAEELMAGMNAQPMPLPMPPTPRPKPKSKRAKAIGRREMMEREATRRLNLAQLR